jgi:hypothetical protein
MTKQDYSSEYIDETKYQLILSSNAIYGNFFDREFRVIDREDSKK